MKEMYEKFQLQEFLPVYVDDASSKLARNDC
jgi:hypothetical protein